MAGQGTVTDIPTTLRGAAFVGGTAIGLLIVSLAGRRRWRLPIAGPRRQLRPALLGATAAFVILFASIAAPTASQAFIYFQF